MKQTIFTVLFLGVSLVAFSQKDESKPGCNPSACKPGNTKVAEAKILTELRSELVSIESDWDPSLGRLAVDFSPGGDDKESLNKMVLAAEQIKLILNRNANEELEVKKYSDRPAKKAAELREELASIREQLYTTK